MRPAGWAWPGLAAAAGHLIRVALWRPAAGGHKAAARFAARPKKTVASFFRSVQKKCLGCIRCMLCLRSRCHMPCVPHFLSKPRSPGCGLAARPFQNLFFGQVFVLGNSCFGHNFFETDRCGPSYVSLNAAQRAALFFDTFKPSGHQNAL